MRYLGAMLLIAALFGAYDQFSMRPIEQPPGVLVAVQPQQTELPDAQPWGTAASG